MKAWPSKTINPSGKRSLVFTYNPVLIYEPDPDGYQEISCGQCVGCKLERSRQWATRCLHEASTHEKNCFITLTFNEESLNNRINSNPKDVIHHDVQSLDQRENQLFMKKLRKKYGSKIKFYHCGEYGDESGRPHYHSLLFNFDFEDKQLLKENHLGDNLYVSEQLEGTKLFKENYLTKNRANYNPQFTLSETYQKGLWPYGQCILGDVTFKSAAYVARYIMKKINGKELKQENSEGLKPYEHLNQETGEITRLKPEYTTMSNGIGKKWFQQYLSDVYPDDFVIINGKKCTPPKYYDQLLKLVDPFEYDRTKETRLTRIDPNHKDLTPARLAIRERIKLIQSKTLVRNHDLQER